MSTKIDAINSLIVFANKAFDGADTMRKAELVGLLAASIKAVRALPDTAQRDDIPADMVVTTMKIEVDDSQVRAALEPLEQLTAAATAAEAALAKLWNIQAAMRYSPPYAGVGSASGSSGPASASAHLDPH